jgi:hypothetical protein
MHDPFSFKVKQTTLREGKKYIIFVILLSTLLVIRMIYEEYTGTSIVDFKKKEIVGNVSELTIFIKTIDFMLYASNLTDLLKLSSYSADNNGSIKNHSNSSLLYDKCNRGR